MRELGNQSEAGKCQPRCFVSARAAPPRFYPHGVIQGCRHDFFKSPRRKSTASPRIHRDQCCSSCDSRIVTISSNTSSNACLFDFIEKLQWDQLEASAFSIFDLIVRGRILKGSFPQQSAKLFGLFLFMHSLMVKARAGLFLFRPVILLEWRVFISCDYNSIGCTSSTAIRWSVDLFRYSPTWFAIQLKSLLAQCRTSPFPNCPAPDRWAGVARSLG